MLSIKFDNLTCEAQVINRDIDGLLLALSDLLDDCTEPLAEPKHDETLALYSLKRNSRSIEAVKEALTRNVRRQATVLARLEQTNLKGGENSDSSN